MDEILTDYCIRSTSHTLMKFLAKRKLLIIGFDLQIFLEAWVKVI
jgi:hypothetical protein